MPTANSPLACSSLLSLLLRSYAGLCVLRWHHSDHGNVSPTELVPIAEPAGLMPDIGAWVLAVACRQAARWPSGLSVSVNVSVNVSVKQLDVKQAFIDCVKQTARGLRPAGLQDRAGRL